EIEVADPVLLLVERHLVGQELGIAGDPALRPHAGIRAERALERAAPRAEQRHGASQIDAVDLVAGDGGLDGKGIPVGSRDGLDVLAAGRPPPPPPPPPPPGRPGPSLGPPSPRPPPAEQ